MIDNKFSHLLEILKEMKSAVLAYSGGADSTFLLKALEFSNIKTLAVTAFSEITPYTDLLSAIKLAESFRIDHMIIKTDVLSQEEFLRNSPDRCFYCKDVHFKKFSKIAWMLGYMYVLDGSNLDDTFDYRPGNKALLKYNVRSPLIEAGFTKNDIQRYSRQLGLPTWNKPSNPCLASRFPYGQRISKKSLKRVELAESIIRSLGFHQTRVRDHGCIARIEVDEDKIDLFLSSENRKKISECLKSLGYKFVSIDIDGYKTGNLNKMLDHQQKDSVNLSVKIDF